MVRSRTAGAGASAYAQYRARLSAGRVRRWSARALLAIAVLAVVAWLWDWRIGLLAAAVVAVADAVREWRTHSSTTAWRKGARGERATARLLRPLERRGYVVLHDRALPRSKANVDHLVIGPPGVFVVDSKAWHRHTRISSGKGRLWIGGRPADSTVRAVTYETRKVADALGTAMGRPVQVTAVVAVHGAKLPRWGALLVSGVTLLRARRVRGWIVQHGTRLDEPQVAAIGAAAERAFPPYVEKERQ
ncbi:nuclease-related domain-containing protein [Nonomuraea rhizosphaerae]|uniref:nuclease-related domain-containing protein n=1 Tax=Nonomuraea rhizosphaerae TaxID=2665663 RepID=UPI001C5FD781|nr:nuclease-related domain-containing protein [Nonomuraea rhizosphaerae]